jgi:signal transduction histidine kinase
MNLHLQYIRVLSSLLALVVFTQRLLVAQTAPLPKIEKIFVDGNSVAIQSDTLKIDILQSDIYIQLSPCEADSFAFFLENFDKKFHKTNAPTTRYTRLKGGHYTLKYLTLQNGISSDTLKLRIEIRKVFSEENWFIPLIIFCLGAAIFSIAYFWTMYNLRQKIKVQKIRNRIAGDLHDEVGAELSSIAISLKTAEKKIEDKAFVQEILTEAIYSSGGIIGNLRDTVWMINPANDDMQSLFNKMQVSATKLFQIQGIRFEFENTLSKPLRISMEQRYNAYMIFKEAINNIAKHAQATQVRVKIEAQKYGVRVEISDNGKGFDTTAQTDGNGLSNFKRRAKESFFDLTLVSEPGKGTILTIIIPEI